MLALPRIETKHALLRLPELSDIPDILRYFLENESHLSQFDPKRPAEFYTDTFWNEQIPRHLDQFLADQALRLYVFGRQSGEVMGTIGFSQICRGPFQACYLGYGIGRKFEGKGLMFEALSAAIAYMFTELNLHRIMANHLPDNERSGRLLARLGFTHEGVAKDYLRINGAWRDHVLTSLHNPDWRENGPGA